MTIAFFSIIAAIVASAATYFIVKANIKAKLEVKSALLDEARKERDSLKEEQKESEQTLLAIERELSAKTQEIRDLTKQMEDWEKVKEEHMKAAKSSAVEASRELSNKLLDDHKRELEEAKKESEKKVKETTEQLHKNFQNVFESMKSFSDRLKSAEETTDVVRRALLSPSGAGNLAEITLENILKSSGLTEGQDYIMQYFISNEDSKNSRPDAVIFLPGNNVMVIDSKASKFFQEIEEADEEDKKALEAQLKQTMNNHLKDLVKRDYTKAIRQESQRDVQHVMALMFLPTESALEKLRKIDSSFMEKAWKDDIMPVSPTGVINMLLQAKMIISNARQEQNAKVIIDEVKNLIGSVASLYEYSDKLGTSIKSTFDKYDKFAASFNRTFLSKVKKLEKLGVSSNKNTQRLKRYHVDDVTNLIEGESEELIEKEIKELENVE